jgi:sulfide:quinone oxidoreductase
MSQELNRRDFTKLVGAAAAGAALGGCGSNEPAPGGKSVVILGGGFGGLTAARELRAALGREHTITLIDRRATFQMGLRKVWILAGLCGRHDGEQRMDAVRSHGVDYRQATITAIDAPERTVRTDAGDVRYDCLLVALGAEPRTDLVAGFSKDVYNLYSADDCERVAPRLKELSKGRVSVGVLAAPYPCPPAPYETAMNLDAIFRKRGIRDQVELNAWTVQTMSLPVIGKAICDDFEARLAKKGITFTAKRKTVKLEGTKAVFEGGELASDVLIVVPPHRPPTVVKQSGLTGEGEWIPIDRATMKTKVEHVWAVGDCTEAALDNKMPLPKAGIIAEAQARVAAAGILAEITGVAGGSWDGKGYCIIEHGGEEAAKTTFDLFNPAGPKVVMPAPSAADFKDKQEFERARLAKWFG